MEKYLQNKNISQNHINIILQLIKQFNEQLLYSSPYMRQLWMDKTFSTVDPLSELLKELYSNTRKYKQDIEKAIFAYGRQLYSR